VTKPAGSTSARDDVADNAAEEAAQRQKDAELLKQQQAESERAQQQQDHQAAEIIKQQQKQDAEPRILDAPRESGMTPVPVPETNQGPARIQDAPIPPQGYPPLPAPSSAEKTQQQTAQPQQQQ
jgi:hypothetical protein